METTVKERLTEYLNFKRVSKSEFGRAIGVSASYVSAIRKSIDKDKLRIISEKYPDLNPSWLLYGEGEMLREAPTAQIVQGDSNTVAGRDLTTSTPAGLVDALNKALDQNVKSQEQVSKAQEQIDRLLGLLEQTQQKQ